MAWRDFLTPVKAIVTAINPVAGAVFQVAENLMIKPTKKVNIMLEGKKTYIGIGVTAAAFISTFFGYDVSMAEQEGLKEAVTAIAGALGLLVATYGHPRPQMSLLLMPYR